MPSFKVLSALALVLALSACSKEELVVPTDAGTLGTTKSSGTGASIHDPGPTNGAISDDGDDQGDNEGRNKRKVKG